MDAGSRRARRARSGIWPASARAAGGWLVDDADLRQLCDTVAEKRRELADQQHELADQEREIGLLRGQRKQLQQQVDALQRQNAELRAQRAQHAGDAAGPSPRRGDKRQLPPGHATAVPGKRRVVDAAAGEAGADVVGGGEVLPCALAERLQVMEVKVEGLTEQLVGEREARRQMEVMAVTAKRGVNIAATVLKKARITHAEGGGARDVLTTLSGSLPPGTPKPSPATLSPGTRKTSQDTA